VVGARLFPTTYQQQSTQNTFVVSRSIRPDVCPIYLHGAFLFHPFVRHQQRIATKGAIMDGLNMEIIKGLSIPLPPLSLQQKFVDIVHRVEHVRAVQREALRQAEHLFASLLHRAFGE
jgi:type I restriction enzyme S subunit